ncbi:MAG: trypsin-like peptidase domain-containing protein [Planctomycetia bacterium]|nr:trypsin-like peptidase domain-containing protein [Planctomycetia bacterium]
MIRFPALRLAIAALLVALSAPALSAPAWADEPDKDLSVEELTAKAKSSIVVITQSGRDGGQGGLGSGFIVSAEGLVATNLHVIGEGRQIAVQTADGKKHEVVTVQASDRAQDLALLKIDAKDLVPLSLGDSDELKEGQAIVAMGNPHGLKNSVVAGVVSGKREIEGKKMIQLAIPIEPGNSGGPLLDMRGRVHGLLTMKSAVTDNLGFAVEINTLKTLIDKPNPVPMARWVRIGQLDPKEWTVHHGARWRSRAGRILVDGFGSGFGGRSYCLSSAKAPEPPFEIAVTVRLDDEAGAAGLIFCADGDRHYGFYPTSGQLRLTRFEGPDVASWTILESFPSKHYRPGDFNAIKVRVENEKLVCFVNGQKVLEFADATFRDGQVGLAKFRQTAAEFKKFAVAEEIRDAASPESEARVAGILRDLAPGAPVDHLVEGLLPDADNVAALDAQARRLEKQAAQIKQLSADVHTRRVSQELAKLLDQEEEKVDLVYAALLVAQLDNPELDVDAYRRQFDALAGELQKKVSPDADEPARLSELTKYLFEEHGFHGSRTEYYTAANSYLNQVLDDREGIPITLSVVYMECARRLSLVVAGVGLPGHFVVKHVPKEGDEQLIDVFEGGKTMTRDEAARLVRANLGQELRDEHLQAAKKRAIVLRMLANLAGLARRAQDAERLLRYQEAIVALSPDSGPDRFLRAILRFQTNRLDGAKGDVAWLLEHEPEGVPLEQVRGLERALEQSM